MSKTDLKQLDKEIQGQLQAEKESAKKKLKEEKLVDGRKQYMKEIKEELDYEFQYPEPDEESLKILQHPNLLNIVDKEFDKLIVGEKKPRKAIFLFSCGRLVENAESTSTNLIVNDETGLGKDYVTRNVLALWGDGVVSHKKRISPTTFTYWHNCKFEPTWSWDNKVVYLEDISNSVLNSDTFKIMTSNERDKISSSLIVIKNSPINIEVRGKPGFILTIADANPRNELLRRFPNISLDSSTDQSKAIVKRWAEFKEKGIRPEYNPKIKKALEFLRPIKVIVPYAKKIAANISYEHPIIRTNFTRFIDIIAFSTALHQYQRETDKEGCKLANEKDYEIGREIIFEITSNKRTIPLTRQQKKIIGVFEKLEKDTKTRLGYSVKELLQHITFLGERQMYRYLDKLSELEVLKRGVREKYSSVDEEGNPHGTKKEITTYQLIKLEKFNLPKWEDLQKYDKIDKVDKVDKHDNKDNQHT